MNPESHGMGRRENASAAAVLVMRIVMWVVWCGFVLGLISYRLFLVGGADNTHSVVAPDSVYGWLSFLIPTGIAVALRWLLIPKLRIWFLVVIPFFISIIASEILTFLGIFLFPQQFQLYFITTWLLLLQLMPIWKLTRQNPDG